MCFILYLLPLHAIHHAAAQAQHQDIRSFFSAGFLNNYVSPADCSGNHAAWQEALGRAQPPWTLEGTKWIDLPCLESGLQAPAGKRREAMLLQTCLAPRAVQRGSTQPSPDGPAAFSLARSLCVGIFWFLEENTELGMFFHCLDVWRVGRVCSDFMSLLSSLWEQDIWALAESSEQGCVQMLSEMICPRLVQVDKQN